MEDDSVTKFEFESIESIKIEFGNYHFMQSNDVKNGFFGLMERLLTTYEVDVHQELEDLKEDTSF